MRPHPGRKPSENDLSGFPRRTPRHPWRERRPTSHRPRLESLETRVVLSPTIFTVDDPGNGTSGFGTSGTLPYVISQANANTNTDGSEIEFDSSVFSSPQTITLGGTQLELSNTTGQETITGPAAGVTVSGGGLSRVFQIDNGVTASISGLTITGGSVSGDGGGMYCNGGTLTLTNVSVSDNYAGHGGAGVENLGTLTVSNCAFTSDTAAVVGGGIHNGGGVATLTNCTFSQDIGGFSGGGGGGVVNYAIMTVNGCTFSGNSGPYGGGLYNGGGTSLAVDDSTFSDNSASVFGGGIDDEGGPLTVDGCTFTGNSANAGGGLDAVFGGSVTVNGSTFKGNSATTGAGFNVGSGSTAVLTNVHYQRKHRRRERRRSHQQRRDHDRQLHRQRQLRLPKWRRCLQPNRDGDY